jgi:hypothetical protein
MSFFDKNLILCEWIKLGEELSISDIHSRRALYNPNYINYGHIIRYGVNDKWKWTVASLDSKFDLGVDFFTGNSGTLKQAMRQSDEKLLLLGWKFSSQKLRIML